jgi:hypothetical protein
MDVVSDYDTMTVAGQGVDLPVQSAIEAKPVVSM